MESILAMCSSNSSRGSSVHKLSKTSKLTVMVCVLTHLSASTSGCGSQQGDTPLALAPRSRFERNLARSFWRMLNQADSGLLLAVDEQPQNSSLTSSFAGRSNRRSGRNLGPRARYCAVSRSHTACKYTEEDQDGHCSEDVKTRGLTPRDKRYILKLHNDLRRKVALGKQRGQPAASNMAELTWDDEAAAIAQLWADQCQFDQDADRHTVGAGRPVYNGQNIFYGEGFSKLDFKIPIAEQWFADEVSTFKSSGISPYGPRRDAQHYTQIVWAETRRVGCGFVWHGEEQIFFCNYAPGGNQRRSQPVYKRGIACSACPRDLTGCNNGLCSEE